MVTGAGAGIGREVAKALAREGVDVFAVARSEAGLQSLEREIQTEYDRRLMWRNLDLTGDDGPATLAREILNTFGAIDILVNNAGRSMPVAWDASDDLWSYGMTLNFDVHRRLTQALLPAMIERKWGRIINVTGSIELKHVNVAASAKAALTVWNKALAHQVGCHGITCNCIEPGLINSNQFATTSPELMRQYASATAFGSFGEPEDLGAAAVFLASEASRYITGTTLIVDGGLRQRSF